MINKLKEITNWGCAGFIWKVSVPGYSYEASGGCFFGIILHARSMLIWDLLMLLSIPCRDACVELCHEKKLEALVDEPGKMGSRFCRIVAQNCLGLRYVILRKAGVLIEKINGRAIGWGRLDENEFHGG